MKPSLSTVLFGITISMLVLAQQAEPVPTKSLGTYKKAGRIWTNLLIPRKLSRERLIKLAQDLHKSEPTTAFRFFDDDSQFQQFKDWDINYPSSVYQYPQKWVKAHHIANLQQMAYDTSGPKWVLIEGYTTEKIADIYSESAPTKIQKRSFSHSETIVNEYDRTNGLTTVRLKPMTVSKDSTSEMTLAALFVQGGATKQVGFITLQFISISGEWQFRNEREFSLLLDNQRVNYGQLNLDIAKVINNVAVESLSINLQYQDFRRITDAKLVQGKLGRKDFMLQENQLEALRDLVSRINP